MPLPTYFRSSREILCCAMASAQLHVRDFFKREERLVKNKITGIEEKKSFDVCTLYKSSDKTVTCGNSYKVCEKGGTGNLQRHVTKNHFTDETVKPYLVQCGLQDSAGVSFQILLW